MTGKLRVLHVVPYFPPDRIGGIGEAAAHIHHGLLERGHESLVLTRGTSRDDPRVHRVAHSAAGFLLKSGLSTGLLGECDVVHCHHGEALGILVANRLRRRVPVLMTLHCSCSGIGRAHRPYRLDKHTFGRDFKALRQRWLIAPARHLLDLAALRLSDRVNFISRHGAVDYLGETSGPTADVIYYGLPELPDRPHSSAGRSSSRKYDVEPVELLYAGAANHRKRIAALPLVLARVREKRPDVRLRVIGFRLEDQPDLVEQFQSLNVLDAVVCEGPRRSDELTDYYRASKVLLVPSAHEGLPMVIIESLQCGTPCVATNVSGHPEVIENGVNGFLVEMDRPDQMADRALQILDDETLHRDLSTAAPKVVQKQFGLEREIREYLAIYESLRHSAHAKNG